MSNQISCIYHVTGFEIIDWVCETSVFVLLLEKKKFASIQLDVKVKKFAEPRTHCSSSCWKKSVAQITVEPLSSQINIQSHGWNESPREKNATRMFLCLLTCPRAKYEPTSAYPIRKDQIMDCSRSQDCETRRVNLRLIWIHSAFKQIFFFLISDCKGVTYTAEWAEQPLWAYCLTLTDALADRRGSRVRLLERWEVKKAGGDPILRPRPGTIYKIPARVSSPTSRIQYLGALCGWFFFYIFF